MDTFEAGIRDILNEIDKLRTPGCLDSISIGLFTEGKLPDKEKRRAEGHLLSCLYCLKQLSDMKQLLYYRKHPAAVSPGLLDRLKALDRQSGDK
jgi:hypothetical protein